MEVMSTFPGKVLISVPQLPVSVNRPLNSRHQTQVYHLRRHRKMSIVRANQRPVDVVIAEF
jgi:hypothetical protein